LIVLFFALEPELKGRISAQFRGEPDSARIVTVLDDYAGYETSFLAQHGIAILLEASSGGVCKRVLLDAG